MRCFILTLLAGLLLLSKAQGQFLKAQYELLDYDTLGFEPTVISSGQLDLMVASQPEGSLTTPKTGNLRLRFYPQNQPINFQSPRVKLNFPGKVRVMSAVASDFYADFFITGGFMDTTYLPNDTLIGFEPLALDPFLMAVDGQTGFVRWVWKRPAAQNNYFTQLSYNGDSSQLLGSGLYNDVSGWLAAFDATNGNLLWEKQWPGARTVSDAKFDPFVPGAILFTGTIDDFGALNQLPTPLTPAPNTGYRCFLARYFPATDVVQFIATVPYITFDFSPRFIADWNALQPGPGYIWTAPYVSATNSQGSQIFQPQFALTGNGYPDSLATEFEFYSYSSLSGGFSSPGWMHKTAGAGPGSYSLSRTILGVSQLRNRMQLSTGSSVNGLGDFIGSRMTWAVKSTGTISFRSDTASTVDTTLTVPGASVNNPRWVMVAQSLVLVNSTEEPKLNFSLYPNPAQAASVWLELNASIAKAGNWTLRDIQGRSLQTGTITEARTMLPTEGLAKGIYLVEIQQQQQKAVKRLVVN